jgi:hypothetical protein
VIGSEPDAESTGADAELERRSKLNGFSVDPGWHGLIGVHLKRGRRPLPHPQPAAHSSIAGRSRRAERGDAKQPSTQAGRVPEPIARPRR